MDDEPHPSAMIGAARAQAALGLLVLVGLVVIAFELGERYPVARFHMFDHTSRAASRVMARRADGQVVELGALRAFSCGEVELFTGPTEGPRACEVEDAYPDAEQRVGRYLARERAEHPGGEPIEIVRRTYRFPDPWGPPAISDCTIGRCTAVTR